MEKMREEFEAWARESTKLWLMPVMFDGEFVNYYDEDTAEAFNVWKASRAALCVELPEVSVLDGGRIAEIGYELAVDDFERALDAAGIHYT